MKERLLVMNGQRIVQAEKDGAWTNQKVDKAGALKPGARAPDSGANLLCSCRWPAPD